MVEESNEEGCLLDEKKGSTKKINWYPLFVGILLFLVVSGIIFLFHNDIGNDNVSNSGYCGDGTLNSTCSLTKPYYCSEGILILDAIKCGCPDILDKKNGSCFNDLYTGEHEINLKYILRGEERFISLKMYTGITTYLKTLPKQLYYSSGEIPRRDDFELMKIKNPIQREALMPLVIAIENSAPNSLEDQARIATSLVQNIGYGEADFESVFGGKYQIRLSRYPYETLEEYTGSCEGKSELLAFLLKELGYGVSVFYYQNENHEAVGIKCPTEYSLNNTGYCFIETTVSSPIGYSTGTYLGLEGGKLSSNPQLILLSKGVSLPDNMYEYEDSKEFDKLISGTGFVFNRNRKFQELVFKYGLNY